mgnify:CR=1 FL=1
MKKILFILVCLSVFSGSFFAQSATETDETEAQEVYEENKTKRFITTVCLSPTTAEKR